MEKLLECVMLTAFDYALLILLLHDRERMDETGGTHLLMVGTMGAGLLLGTVGKLTARPVEAVAAFYLVACVLSAVVFADLLVRRRRTVKGARDE